MDDFEFSYFGETADQEELNVDQDDDLNDHDHLPNENSVYLSRDVSQIKMEFLNFRRDTFVFFKATPRKASDYVKYDKPIFIFYPLTEFTCWSGLKKTV